MKSRPFYHRGYHRWVAKFDKVNALLIPLDDFNAQQKGIYQAAKEKSFKMVGKSFFGIRFEKVQIAAHIVRPENPGDRNLAGEGEIN